MSISGVPDVYEVARYLRLKVREEDLETCDGLLIRPKGVLRGIIAINKGIRSDGRKRFTIAHEIGHYVLPGHDEHGTICERREIEGWGDNSNRIERQADDFAAELLIPTGIATAHIVRSTPSLKVVEALANECKTSLSASAWRYCDLTSERCAIVWSTQGTVTWSKAAPEFHFFIKKGKPVESNSFAYDCFAGGSVPFSPESVRADAWIDSFNLKEGSRIYEESRCLPNFESVLTLLWIKEPIEKTTEFDEADDQPLNPNDFTLHRKRWPR